MTRLLVSVRSVDEALLAAALGVDLIDLKEPREGALGGLPVARIREIAAALRATGHRQAISATIGDWTMEALPAILARVDAVAGCGVDYVKVGIERDPAATGVLSALAACGRPVIPVFIADQGIDLRQVAQACRGPFPALMLDTADKQAGSLFDCIDAATLHAFLATCREAGKWAGLAGALRVAHLPRLCELAPDFAGFRSAVCTGARTAALDAERVRGLGRELRELAVAAA